MVNPFTALPYEAHPPGPSVVQVCLLPGHGCQPWNILTPQVKEQRFVPGIFSIFLRFHQTQWCCIPPWLCPFLWEDYTTPSPSTSELTIWLTLANKMREEGTCITSEQKLKSYLMNLSLSPAAIKKIFLICIRF